MINLFHNLEKDPRLYDKTNRKTHGIVQIKTPDSPDLNEIASLRAKANVYKHSPSTNGGDSKRSNHSTTNNSVEKNQERKHKEGRKKKLTVYCTGSMFRRKTYSKGEKSFLL